MIRSTRRWLMAGLSLLSLTSSATPAFAQSDVLLQLRSGSPAGDRYRVDSAGGFLALGSIGIGIIPASGEGYRMMWYPYKVAFRAGYADAGGQMNDANIGFYSWGGGALSIASGIYSFAMGNQAHATGQASVAIGNNTNALGTGSVALGSFTSARANYSTALGYHASSGSFTGTFVWGDQSAADSIVASANNQFSVRAAGGARFYSNALKTTGVKLDPGAGAWNNVSDRNLKENFVDVSGEDVLAKLRDVPVSRWNYRDDETKRAYMGPMAQDWHRAFALGDSVSINTMDLDGVSLAAIRALDERTTELRKRSQEVDQLRIEVSTLRDQNARLEARLKAIEDKLAAQPKR
jgi:hypothetical protein